MNKSNNIFNKGKLSSSTLPPTLEPEATVILSLFRILVFCSSGRAEKCPEFPSTKLSYIGLIICFFIDYEFISPWYGRRIRKTVWEQFDLAVLVLLYLSTICRITMARHEYIKNYSVVGAPTNVDNGFCLSPRLVGAILIFRAVLRWYLGGLLYFRNNFEHPF